MIGFMLCLLFPNAPIFKERKLGMISDVYVKEELRGKGIGKQMLRVALRWFDKNKVKTVELNVAAANIEARRAWARLGFTAHMIHKRIDVDGPEANALLAETGTRVVKKIIRKKNKK
jgi:ribosomal protein S18 acetylase RimI-like enzyme